MAPKYRHRGYMDDAGDDRPREKRKPRQRDVFRGRSEGRYREEVFRCHNCSERILHVDSITIDDTCPKCGTDLHSCQNCRYFNPAARNECQKEIPKRVPRKAVKNECSLFSPKIVLDLISAKSTRPAGSADDARRAFEDLFKK